MEELRRLERVQRMLALIDSHGLSSGLDLNSHRFLAHLLLLFVQHSGMLSVEKKFSLTLDFLNKVKPEVIEELKYFEVNQVDQGEVDVYSDPPASGKNDDGIELEGPKFLEMPLICLDSMHRANSTLEDFCRSYFMFHGLDVNRPESIFKFLPILSFTESYIYQLDSWNEWNLCKGSEDTIVAKGTSDNDNIEEKFVKIFPPKVIGSDPFNPLIILLEDQGLITDRIKDELMSGMNYWVLETKLCQAIIRKQKILIEDVLQAIRLKSFDYRVLNLLLYQLRGQEVNELHMEFLALSEFLVEISDDLDDNGKRLSKTAMVPKSVYMTIGNPTVIGCLHRFNSYCRYDYEDDVLNNTFNILRMFVAVYGASLAPKMLIKCITDAEKKYEASSRKLDLSLSCNYWRRCEEATKEGGLHNSGYAYGKWSIPPLIVDEDAFRAQHN